MSKHFHGRRYQRARASVAIGRMKKRERKLNRIIHGINTIDWSDTIEKIVLALECFQEKLLKVAKETGVLFQEKLEHMERIANEQTNH